MMSISRWFARDPAAVTAQVVSAVVALLALLPLNNGINAALAAAVTALGGMIVAFVVVRDGQLAALLGFTRAGLALVVVLQVPISDTYQAMIIIAVEQIASLFIRTQVVAPLGSDGSARSDAMVG
jgi:hypothetical protein